MEAYNKILNMAIDANRITSEQFNLYIEEDLNKRHIA